MSKNKKELIGPKTKSYKENLALENDISKKAGHIAKAKKIITPVFNFPIVGIGASAGGLAAFEAFFSAMPADTDTGVAFVLVQHLAPDHKSILSELVKRYTSMEVFEVTDGIKVEPNCTYIIPPNHDMGFLKGSLQLFEPGMPHGQRLPIDFFFRSLAQDRHEQSICIVLSGTGSDGTLGVRAIKGEGGMAMAQSPESAGFDGMPRSAIATGLIDFTIPPEEMPGRLIAYLRHSYGKNLPKNTYYKPVEENSLKKIFILLRNKVGHDFSQYRKSTVKRRIERRLAINQIEGLENYVRFLQMNPLEIEELFHDLLIGVSSFFRDSKAFESVAEKVIKNLFNANKSNDSVRIWVVGCSTGEEPYSIAMLIKEQLESLNQSFKIQIFATDIEERSINVARSAVYPANIVSDISPQRLARFFVMQPDGTSYRIRKEIRDMVIFSEQNISMDPPFSKLDFISCRNLLIYLEKSVQRKILPLFHYSLNPGGFLFLGSSETADDFKNLFKTVDRSARIYQRSEGSDPYYKSISSVISLLPKGIYPNLNSSRNTFDKNRIPLRELAEHALLEQYSPMGALVDKNGVLLYLYGKAGMFLEPAPGEFEKSILKMARKGLRRELTVALTRAAAYKETVHYRGLRVKINGVSATVNLTVRPVRNSTDSANNEDLFLVIFESDEAIAQKKSEETTGLEFVESTDEDLTSAIILSLTEKLRVCEEYLQSSNEELETSTEELSSSNEEMLSLNEELQSSNEELETSKEELQSLNEELSTVNSELRIKLSDLSRTYNDLSNLMSDTDCGSLFVDHQLTIRKFTPAVTQAINLIQTDIGRPISHISTNLVDHSLLTAEIEAVIYSLVSKETEVMAKDGTWYSMRISPYRTSDNIIDGAIITFCNITKIKNIQKTALELEANYKDLFLYSFSAIAVFEIVFDKKGVPSDYIFIDANLAFEKHVGLNVKDLMGKRISDVCPGIKAADLITTYRLASIENKSVAFKVKFKNLKKTFNVCSYSVSSNRIGFIFENMDDKKEP